MVEPGVRRGRGRSTTVVCSAGLLAVALALAGCSPEPDGPTTPTGAPTPTVDGPALDVSGPVDVLLVPDPASPAGTATPLQIGTARVDVAVVTLEGGSVLAAPSRDGGTAFDLPAFDASPAPPRAVLSVTPADPDDDPLSPGEEDFEFGADFLLDTESSGTDVDNGDNLLQRGLSSDPYRFKAEVDGGRATCTVRGSLGELVARAEVTIEPGRWYRLRCRRDDDRLAVRLVEYDGETELSSSADQARGPLGDVAPPAGAPLSVGGKLSQSGQVIASATDQFNGLVANPILVIG